MYQYLGKTWYVIEILSCSLYKQWHKIVLYIKYIEGIESGKVNMGFNTIVDDIV